MRTPFLKRVARVSRGPDYGIGITTPGTKGDKISPSSIVSVTVRSTMGLLQRRRDAQPSETFVRMLAAEHGGAAAVLGQLERQEAEYRRYEQARK